MIQANNANPKLKKNLIKDSFGKQIGSYDFIYEPPQWYYMINPHIELGNNMFGKILLSYAIFRTSDLRHVDPKYFGNPVQNNQTAKLSSMPKMLTNTAINAPEKPFELISKE